MDDRETTHNIQSRLSGLELRVKAVEQTLEMSSSSIKEIRDDLKRELSRQSEELALTRQAVRIFEDTVQKLDGQLRTMRSESKEILSTLHAHIIRSTEENQKVMVAFSDHLVSDARDKTKMFAGVVTSALAGMSTLGVLIWGVMQVVAQ